MTGWRKRTVIEMAREANLYMTSDERIAAVEAFAKLVREDEREEIARMIEDAPPLVDFCKNDKGGCVVCGFTPKFAANAIRERNNHDC